MEFITDCVHSDGRSITAMVDRAREVSYRTARRRIGRELCRVFSQYDWSTRPRDLTLKNDYHVRYFRSVYRARVVYYLQHSAIEYVFA